MPFLVPLANAVPAPTPKVETFTIQLRGLSKQEEFEIWMQGIKKMSATFQELVPKIVDLKEKLRCVSRN